MKAYFLFPYWCRYLGYACIVGHIPFSIIWNMCGMHRYDNSTALFNNGHVFFICTTLLMALGLFLVAFAKERIEDEQIAQLRLDSLRWAIYLNYLLLIISLVFIADTEHILVLNLWVPLIFFIIRFRWKIYQNNSLLKKEEDTR